MRSYYIEIATWFALMMAGHYSVNAPDVFRYDTTIGGRYVCSSNAVNYYSFDTLVNAGWVLKLEALPVDSFPRVIDSLNHD